MLLSKFVLKSTFRRCIQVYFFVNYDAKFAPHIIQICPKEQQKSSEFGVNKVP